MNRPLTIWGADRRWFLLALLMGSATFNLFGGLLGGIVMASALYAIGVAATAIDPQLPRILLNSTTLRCRYDPAKLACTRERRRSV